MRPPSSRASRAPWALAGLVALAACAGEARTPAPAQGLNLVLITLDTTRADHVTCLGGREGVTPEIDRLAARGTLFEEAYSVANVTKPTHLSILTGQRLIEHGVFGNGLRIPEGLRTLPDELAAQGYATAAFVSMVDLGPESAWPGLPDVDAPEVERRADETLPNALRWLRERPADGRPFFLWTHFFDPHTLYDPPPIKAARYYRGDPRRGDGPLLLEHPFLRARPYPALEAWLEGVRDPAYPKALYAAEVRHADQHVGLLLKELARLGLEGSTVVVVVADHGESLDEHEILYAHLGLYEVSLRIPLVIVVPGFPEGLRAAERVTQLDLAETLAELFGCTLDGTAGASLVPLLAGERQPELDRRDLVFEASQGNQVALRRGRWKLIWPLKAVPGLADAPELFDLDADPGETRDLAAAHPEVVDELRPALEPWLRRLQAPREEPAALPDRVQRELEGLGYTGD